MYVVIKTTSLSFLNDNNKAFKESLWVTGMYIWENGSSVCGMVTLLGFLTSSWTGLNMLL